MNQLKDLMAEIGVELPAYHEQPKPNGGCNFTDWSGGEKPKPLATNTNLSDLLAHCGMGLRVNQMNLALEVVDSNGALIGSDWNVTRSDLFSAAARNGFPKAGVDDHAANVAAKNAYHPVKQWLDGGKWDGVKRVERVIDCIPSADPAFTRTVITKWLVSCVAALYEQRFSTKLTPVLKGGQSFMKTAFVSRLASVVDGAFLEGLSLDPTSKDSVSATIKSWVCELGEIGQTTRKGNDALKAFLTMSQDKIRLPYDRAETIKPRQTCFIGTVNDDHFLRDESGSTRFAVVEMTAPVQLGAVNELLGWSWSGGRLRHDKPELLRQFWLEVKALYNGGAGWALTEQEQERACAVNDEFAEKTAQYQCLVEEHIAKPHYGKRWVAASDVVNLRGEKSSMVRMWGKALALLAKEGVIEMRKGRCRRTEYLLPMPKQSDIELDEAA
ncbi:VapE domain-containing protein [Aeromonas veronii]|uniref:VapE domain-containing protein n=1 Tax=Aeromonas veronii TaxID=654 RepID=UPI003B9F203E